MTHDVSAEQLKALRLAAGLDLAVLARQVSLSPAQLMQLESGLDSLFYTPAIRRQAARKVYFHLTGQWPANTELASISPEPPEEAQVQPMEPLAETGPALDTPAAPMPQASASWPIRPMVVGSAMLMGLGLMVWLLAGRTVGLPTAAPPQLAGQAPVTAPDSQAGPSDGSSPSGLAVAQAAVLKGPPVGTATEADLVAMLPTSGLPAAPAMRAESLARCDHSDEPAVKVHLPAADTPSVRLVSAVSQWVCVTDGSGLPTQLRLAAGQVALLAGSAPWELQAGSLKQVQIDVQGIKLAWPAELKNRAQLLAPQ